MNMHAYLSNIPKKIPLLIEYSFCITVAEKSRDSRNAEVLIVVLENTETFYFEQ